MKIKPRPTKRKIKRRSFDPDNKPERQFQRFPQLNKFYSHMALRNTGDVE